MGSTWHVGSGGRSTLVPWDGLHGSDRLGALVRSLGVGMARPSNASTAQGAIDSGAVRDDGFVEAREISTDAEAAPAGGRDPVSCAAPPSSARAPTRIAGDHVLRRQLRELSSAGDV